MFQRFSPRVRLLLFYLFFIAANVVLAWRYRAAYGEGLLTVNVVVITLLLLGAGIVGNLYYRQRRQRQRRLRELA